MTHGIFWLASYPKSGNTWVRALLTNYWRNGSRPTDINQLGPQMLTASRDLFDALTGLDCSLLTDDEIDLLRPMVCDRIAAEASPPAVLKVHDAFTVNSAGNPLFPRSASRGVVYVVRNPLDIVASYSAHTGQAMDRIIDRMSDETCQIETSSERLAVGLRQRLLSWSSHARSWLDSGLPFHVVRYEDLLNSPTEILMGLVRFLGLEADPARAERAVAFSSFEELADQERQRAFWERSRHAAAFFRRGVAGSWRSELQAEQALRVQARHAQVMRQFGYAVAGDNPA